MNAITKRRDRFVETEIDGETVIMALDTGDFFSLADSAMTIWRQLDHTPERAALLAAVAGEFGTTSEAIAGDVDAFLGQLGNAGFICEN